MPVSGLVRALAALFLTLVTSGCVGIFGETVSLSHDELKPPANPASGPIAMPKVAHGGPINRDIGYATVTVFGFTDGTIDTPDPVGVEMGAQVADALQGAPSTASPPTPGRDWLWPWVPTWGSMSVELSVHRPDGCSTPYLKMLNAKGHSFCLSGNCAYTRATRMATTRLLDQIVVEATSEPFRNALKMEPAPSVAQEPSSPPTPP